MIVLHLFTTVRRVHVDPSWFIMLVLCREWASGPQIRSLQNKGTLPAADQILHEASRIPLATTFMFLGVELTSLSRGVGGCVQESTFCWWEKTRGKDLKARLLLEAWVCWTSPPSIRYPLWYLTLFFHTPAFLPREHLHKTYSRFKGHCVLWLVNKLKSKLSWLFGLSNIVFPPCSSQGTTVCAKFVLFPRKRKKNTFQSCAFYVRHIMKENVSPCRTWPDASFFIFVFSNQTATPCALSCSAQREVM